MGAESNKEMGPPTRIEVSVVGRPISPAILKSMEGNAMKCPRKAASHTLIATTLRASGRRFNKSQKALRESGAVKFVVCTHV